MRKNDLFDLSGRVSLVTGGSSGLGRTFCEAMAEQGSHVAFSYNSNEQGARETEAMIKQHGVKALTVKADVSRPGEVKAMFLKLDQEFGKLDVLINNAGVDIRPTRIHEMSLDEWNRIIATNLTGMVMCLQEGIKIMLRQKKGSIINLTSAAGLVGSDPRLPPSPGYVTSKHGVVGLTKQAALQYVADGIRVNAIAPGSFPTRIGRNADIPEEKLGEIGSLLLSLTPMGRHGDPAELKGIAIYLASDASSFVTGTVSPVDGGFTCW